MDKTEKFLSRYRSNHTNELNFSKFIYISAKTKGIVIDKFGECLIEPRHLDQGSLPSIQSAIDKNKYFASMAKVIWGDTFDYSLVAYKNMNTNIEIICSIHGIVKITPANHLTSVTGCGKCGQVNSNEANKKDPTGWSYSQWEEKAKKSKDFESFKLYILECYDEDTNEKFYKIGKTYVPIKKRFRSHSRFPYNYKVILELDSSAKRISKIEKILQKINNDNKYLPLKHFDGKYECFNKLNLKIWTFIKNNSTLTEISM